MLNALVLRITTEHQKSKKKTLDLRKKAGKRKNKNGPIIIDKCWNVIRMFAEHPFFSNDMVPVIEQACTPLVSIIMQTTSLDFDDDIVFFLCSLLRKKQATNS